MSSSLNSMTCSHAPAGLTLATATASVPAVSFTVVNIQVAAGLVAASSNALPGAGVNFTYLSNDKFTNTNNAPLVVTYSVFPVSAAGCAGSVEAIALTVNAEPVIAPSLNKTVCSSVKSDLILNTNATSAPAFHYTISARTVSPGISAGSSNAAVPAASVSSNYLSNDVFTNMTPEPQNVTYIVFGVSSLGCTAQNTIVKLTINPERALSGSLDATVCSGSPGGITLNTSFSSVAAGSYNILSKIIDSGLQNTPANAAVPDAGTSASILAGDLFANGSPADQLVKYLVEPVSAAGCVGASAFVTLTVKPGPSLSAVSAADVCADLSSYNPPHYPPVPVSFQSPVGSADQYSIIFMSDAINAGFENIGPGAIIPSPIGLTVPYGNVPAGLYKATLHLFNSASESSPESCHD